ncbi:hypothetical protein MNBD_GAMMA01-2130 [hydrothermal vent metagenome]|uniref:Uncharacterized protein n=1 Tax=hydrothermal vent metagenome TaxID=652676 RepID=A0A3B0V936_9ZZZZ
MTKNKHIVIILILSAVVAVAYHLIWNQSQPNSIQSLPTNFKLGIVNKCRKIPEFISKLNMQQPALDSKQQGHAGGLLIRDIRNQQHVWQHSSWQQSGFIGGYDRDKYGNIYVAPLPYVSLHKNPPAQQNQIYIIDNKTAQMSLFMQMPSAAIPNNKNPFGTMGVFYDCDTNSLYVSSIAGSLPKQEKGVIYQIDLDTKQVVSQFNNTDAVGIGVFNSINSKKLYFGSARNSHVYSTILDENGHFIGGKKYELSLSNISNGNSTVVKKIIINKVANKFNMILKEIEFGFRLVAENNPNRKKYHFQYSLSQDKWDFIQVSAD